MLDGTPLMRTLHTGLRVADRDTSVAFYRALGYIVVGTVPDSPIGHLTMLKLPHDEFVSLELVSPSTEMRPAEPGLDFLVIATPSLDRTTEILADNDITVGDTEDYPNGIRLCYVTDPDGNTIELVQWPDGHPEGMNEADFQDDRDA